MGVLARATLRPYIITPLFTPPPRLLSNNRNERLRRLEPPRKRNGGSSQAATSEITFFSVECLSGDRGGEEATVAILVARDSYSYLLVTRPRFRFELSLTAKLDKRT
jgi:hypothetical protein